MKVFKRKTIKKTEGAKLKFFLRFLNFKKGIRGQRPRGQNSQPFWLEKQWRSDFLNEKFVSIARGGKFPSHFCSKTMTKLFFKGEIRLHRLRGQITQPFLLKNVEKVICQRRNSCPSPAKSNFPASFHQNRLKRRNTTQKLWKWGFLNFFLFCPMRMLPTD